MQEPISSFRVLILNGDLPVFPGWGGIEFLYSTRLAQLVEKVGIVSLVHTSEQKEKVPTLSDAGVSLYLWENPHLASKPAPSASAFNPSSLLKQVGKKIYQLRRYKPWQPRDTTIQELVFRNLSAPLLQALSDSHWQALIIVQSNRAPWIDALPSFPVRVLVMHDVRALLYERQGRIAPSWLQRRSCSLQAWLYRRFERKYCSRYDLVITVSSADEAWVRRHYQPPRLLNLPIPVDGDYFSPAPEEKVARARVLFSGMMNHPPNVDAACFFAREIFPLVQSEIPEAEFWIVGRDPTEEVQALAQLPGIVVTGVVPDIRPYIREATVFVVPLRFGSGMRQKILEAWGMQKCVIATSLGAEGIDYRDGENILIADDAPTLAATVIQAIRDPELRERIRMEGRERIFQQHHPGILAKKYHDGIASILREKKKKEAPFHALIDLRWMHPQFAGGIENLSRSFLNHLLHLDSFNQYLVLLPPETRYDFDMRHRPNFRIRMGESQKYDWRSLVRRACQGVLHRLRIPPWQPPELRTLRRVRSFKTEIALSIPGYISPDLYPLLNVLVVPDVQHEFYPEFFLPQHLEERKRVYTDSIRRADHICTISEFTRRTLIERLGISPEKVTTTHLAADPLFHPQDSSHGNHSQILKKYGLKPGEYLLFPGNTWPHKNHRTALRALHLLRETHHFDPVLVCTGAFKEAHGELNQIIQDLRLQKQVKFLGYLPAGDMPTLYKGAAALFFPSLFEGFGIPLLEAMWCDCPVICSRTTSLPEIAGEAALLVDPLSPEEQAEAISRVLNRKDLRISLVERGRRQARKFSWSRFTTTVVRILYEVRESHRG